VRENSVQTIQADIASFDFASGPEDVDAILMLDVIEHLREPEMILKKIRQRYSREQTEIILTTANIAFFPIRLALLLGQFNYGRHGILDLDHSRLFTFYSMRRALLQGGYVILEERGIPAPFYLAFGNRTLARLFIRLNRFLIGLSKSLFSYQIAIVARPTPVLEVLLENAVQSGQMKVKEVEVAVEKNQ